MSNILSNIMKTKLCEFEEYFKANTESLIGYVMELSYETGSIITNDFYKVKNNGIPKNSFLIIRRRRTRYWYGGNGGNFLKCLVFSVVVDDEM